MNDPHVEWLKFRVETPPQVSYSNPPPVVGKTPSFTYRLEREVDGDILTIELTEHFATEGEASGAVRPFLKDWEVSAALNGALDEVKFRFVASHIIDRAPTAGAPHTRHGTGVGLGLTGAVKAELVKNTFPAPPSRFRCNDEVAVMWNRFANHRKGAEPLLSVAYFCFSYVCLTAGSRAAAAARYNVDEVVLKQISTLAATRGDLSEARKAEKDSTATPLTDKEKAWLKEVLKVLIERLAAYAADQTAPFTPITLAHLPPL